MLKYYECGIINAFKTIQSTLFEADLAEFEREELLKALDCLKKALNRQ